ncbi:MULTISPECIES: energy-coupling factor transporter transmembrane component T family protein [unclassified Aureimonas]|uniref:energy-coupling factor transporter transmembrane component T family protein n=1 Tax=unclassified Aureimonas TaxID=2615206 RepID=UPI0006F7B5CA|nr:MULTISPECIES: energy-coupling factor transporter transmembrane protein EcfT [unclassified Aureimonas]KQT69027.1 cobalt ABC transporter permease [Aureimonas sp. Leaf460]KQT69261.1 cobalt ABC transporter permease [Aureimonas sp. Leaf427]
MIASLYRPGESLLHRMAAGPKLLALALVGTLLFLLPSLPLVLGALAMSLLLFPLAGLPLAAAWRAMKGVLLVLLLVGAAQLWLAGWREALLVTARLAGLLLLAGLVTATTRMADMVESFERVLGFLRPFGVDPARIALAIALAIRFIPVLATIAAEIREAQAARGLERSVLAMGVPLILRTLRMADEVAEAIDARS